MDSNKDEAERCIELAERYIKEKKLKDAEKFLRKAKKLYPTQKAEDLLTKVKSLSNQNMKTESEPSVRKRHSANKESSHNHNTEYTKEQLEGVKRIKKCKDYYEILGVSKDATDSEIKKAYKKLALLLHPDKNKAPGASEAFKAVGNAIAILTDVEKRKQYDLYGPEEERVQTNPTRPTQTRYNYTRGFEADLTAEELFTMFFGGGIPQQEFYVRRAGRWNRQQEAQGQNAQPGNGNYTTFIQSLLLMLLILISMMSSFFMSDPVYSLHANAKYTVARKTQELNVPYYVKENFQNDYQGSLQRLETSVQDEYILNLRQACYRERNYKDALLWKARSFQDQEMFYKARNIETPSCQKLQDLQVT